MKNCLCFDVGDLAEAPILTRLLSSGLPRHLTCTFTWLLFQEKAVAIRRLEMTLLAQLQYHTLDLWQTDLIFTPQHLLLANCYKVLWP